MTGIVVVQPLPWLQRQPEEEEDVEETEEVEKTEGYITTYHDAMALGP